MSKKQNVKMIEVVALHDLSYMDHEGQSQYRRQGSRPFALDQGNVDQFLRRKAVKLVDAPVVGIDAHDADVEADDFAEEEFDERPAANVEEEFDEQPAANVEKEASANPVKGFLHRGKKGR